MYTYVCTYVHVCEYTHTHTHTHYTKPQEQMTENSVMLELEYLKNGIAEHSAARVKEGKLGRIRRQVGHH